MARKKKTEESTVTVGIKSISDIDFDKEYTVTCYGKTFKSKVYKASSNGSLLKVLADNGNTEYTFVDGDLARGNFILEDGE